MTNVQFKRIPINQLDSQQLRVWSDLQEGSCKYASPFFRPEYAQLYAAARGAIEVCVLSENSKPVGFLPLEVKSGLAQPPRYPFTMVQGAVVREDVEWSPVELLSACQLSALHFDHMIRAQHEFQRYCRIHRASYSIDLSSGFDEYREQKRRSGTHAFAHAANRLRKLQREVGPVEVSRDDDPDALILLLRWKDRQCRRTGVASIYSFPWTTKFLAQTLRQNSDCFRGELWSLRVNRQLVAAHLLLRAQHVAQGWVMGYDTRFRTYSPGMLLLLRMLEELPRTGIHFFDLGTGYERYKAQLMTHQRDVSEGSIDLHPVRGSAWNCWLSIRDAVRNSPLRRSALRVERTLANIRRKHGHPY